ALASAVQFLEGARHAGVESASMRLEATRRTFNVIKHCDFGKIIDRRGTRTGIASVIVMACLATLCVLLWPAQARTALARLAYPFGALEWPKQTTLEILSDKTKIGRNHRYEVHGIVGGVIPERASIQVRTDN